MASPQITGTPGIVARSPDHHAVAALAELLAADDVAASVAWHREPNSGLLRATGDADAITQRARTLPDAVVHGMVSRRLRRHRVTWPAGRPTPGVALVFDIQRHQDLDAGAFHQHWRDSHGPVALAHHLGMWDYDQISIVDRDPADPSLDGIAVVSFPTAEDAADRFFDSAEGQSVVSADAASFTDAATLERAVTTEHVVVDAPPPASGAHDWADHRSVALSGGAHEAWSVVAAGDEGPPTLRAHGPSVLQRRDDERMLWLRLGGAAPDGVSDVTSRWDVRVGGAGAVRLDWSVRASVVAGAEDAFAVFVDQLWDGLHSDLADVIG